MSKSPYLTAPLPSDKLPAGIKYIVGNEAAERFSFYGMKAILVVFMTKYLLDRAGNTSVMTDADAQKYYHWFVASAYFTPILGSILADVFLGKYRTILFISIFYCFGHLALALDETRLGLTVGLTLIAIGAGGIKPCVAANVGDQFGKSNEHLLSKVFGWFYFSINLGAFASQILTPRLLTGFGPSVAFGVPGALMLVATIVFWLGRKSFVHVPPAGLKFFDDVRSPSGRKAIFNLIPLYLCVAVFWALYDQHGSSWVVQAERMDRQFGVEWLSSQVQSVNGIMILAFIPLFTYVVYPAINKVFPLTPLRKAGLGFFLTVATFGIVALIDATITGGRVFAKPSSFDPERTSASNLLEEETGVGWISAVDPKFPQEIVLRLRERQPWEIDKLALTLTAGSADWLPALGDKLRQSKNPVAGALATPEDPLAGSAPRDIEIFVADSPAKDQWRSVAKAALPPPTDAAANEPIVVEFANGPQSAAFVKLSIASNHGGRFVALGSLKALAAGAAPKGASAECQARWPNVSAIGYKPNIGWQLLAYVVLTAAEVLVSITCLEFSYTQAPKTMKSFIMGMFYLSVSLGNVFTGAVNGFIQNADGTGKLEGPAYFWFFSATMLAASVVFLLIAGRYKGQSYVQDESPAVKE